MVKLDYELEEGMLVVKCLTPCPYTEDWVGSNFCTQDCDKFYAEGREQFVLCKGDESWSCNGEILKDGKWEGM